MGKLKNGFPAPTNTRGELVVSPSAKGVTTRLLTSTGFNVGFIADTRDKPLFAQKAGSQQLTTSSVHRRCIPKWHNGTVVRLVSLWGNRASTLKEPAHHSGFNTTTPS